MLFNKTVFQPQKGERRALEIAYWTNMIGLVADVIFTDFDPIIVGLTIPTMIAMGTLQYFLHFFRFRLSNEDVLPLVRREAVRLHRESYYHHIWQRCLRQSRLSLTTSVSGTALCLVNAFAVPHQYQQFGWGVGLVVALGAFISLQESLLSYRVYMVHERRRLREVFPVTALSSS